MAYGLQTEGGFAGGLASGLQFGLNEGGTLYNQQANRDLQKQRMSQDRVFQQKSSDRADVSSRIELDNHQDQAYQKDIEDLQRKTSLAQGHEREMLQGELDATQQARRQLHEHSHLQVVDHGLDQTSADAKAVASGKVDIHDLPDNRASNVGAQALAAPAITGVDGDHHITATNQDGRAPLNQAHDDFMDKSSAGDHLGAAQAAFPLVGPHLSGYQSDHALYSPGFNRGDSGMDPGDPNAMIGQGHDIIGRKGAALAAISSDPDYQQQVIRNHQAGGTQQQMAALHTIAAVGGRDKLKQAAAPSPLEQSYDQHKAAAIQAGASPDAAHDQAMKAAVKETDDQVKARRLSWYIQNGYEVPKDLQESDKEQAAKKIAEGYLATGKYSEAESKAMGVREAYSPSIVAEGLRAASEKDIERMRAASAEKVANIRTSSHRGGLQAYLDSVDDAVDAGTMTPEEGEKAKQGRIQGEAHRYDKAPKTVTMEVIDDPKKPWIKRKVTQIVLPDGHTRPMTPEEAAVAAPQPGTNAAPVPVAPAPNGKDYSSLFEH